MSSKTDSLAAAKTVNASRHAQARTCDDLYGKIIGDIHDMLDFVRAEGKVVPEDLRTKVSELCYGKQEDSNPPEIAIKESGVEPQIKQPQAEPAVPKLSLALEIHGKLSQIVEPANPRTIRASRLTGRFKFFADNATVKFLFYVSLFSLFVFLVLAVYQATLSVKSDIQAANATNSTTNVTTSFTNATGNVPGQPHAAVLAKITAPDAYTGLRATLDILMLLAAAGLGSAFYGLYTAHKYIVNCTFDPKYHQVYLIRFVLGLTSGTILGFFGKDLHLMDDAKGQLGASVLALVGGYAAEAVSQILQRFAETLVTVVRGSNDDVLQARDGELKAKAKQKEAQTKSELVKGLLKAKELAITQSPPSSGIADEIQKTIDSLSK